MMRCSGILLVAALLSFSVPLHAEEPGKAGEALKIGGAVKASPEALKEQEGTTIDLSKVPLLQNLMRNGSELYYIGERFSMHGFVIYKEGRLQMVYLTPDRKGLVFGSVYSHDGVDLSAQQVENASKENVQLKALLAAASEQQRDLERATRSNVRDAVNEQNKKILPAGGGASLTPGERLLNDFISATGVVVGQDNKPLLLMLVDPQCAHCKATWAELYEPVKKGLLRVKLIPIGPEGSENEKQAARFLRIKDPLESWNKFAQGDKSVLAGEPPLNDLSAVRATMTMVLGWKIQATPYLVYRATDGKVKVVHGKPDKIASMLADLIP